jgi:hypothetical protein
VSDKAEAAWAALNQRQRLYLRAILDLDQEAEAHIKRLGAKRIATPPASEWRMITYDVKLPHHLARGSRTALGYSTVQIQLRERGEHDDGSGSTLAALRRRGLISVDYDQVYLPLFNITADRIRVRLTTAGRAAARAGAGRTAPVSVPAGLLSRWSLVALVRLYRAGEEGLAHEAPLSRDDAAPSWNTLLRLRDRRDGALMEEFRPTTGPADAFGMRPYRVRLTLAGRIHLGVHRACYAELYPDLEVELPEVEPVAGAHTALADHRTTRPRHLVRVTDLRVLLRLAEMETTGRCYLREVIDEQERRWGGQAPDWVAKIPTGLLRWQVKDMARTDKAVDRLVGHAGGALVEQVEAYTGMRAGRTTETTPMIVLTEHGREHLREHADEYRRLYPDVAMPAEITTDR